MYLACEPAYTCRLDLIPDGKFAQIISRLSLALLVESSTLYSRISGNMGLSKKIQNQYGIALITALVTLLIVTIIGISSLHNSYMQSKIAASTKEFYSTYQAAETALSIAKRNSPSFTAAIISGNTVSIPVNSVNGLYTNTTLAAEIDYVGEGTLVFSSSIGTFKPQFFAINATANRTGSKGFATHSQGYRILAPSN